THGEQIFSEEFVKQHRVTIKIKELVKSCPNKMWVEKIHTEHLYNIFWGLGHHEELIVYYK
ncbi:hypothetical protein LCGC14_1761250, partial [marine sediment metagenome]